MTHTLTTLAAQGRTVDLLEDAARRRTARTIDVPEARFRIRWPHPRRQI